MEKKVTVSVIMGVYNPNTAYFLQAIHSIINQDLPEWELLIYDDGSETKYKPLINKAATIDQRLSLIHIWNRCAGLTVSVPAGGRSLRTGRNWLQ